MRDTLHSSFEITYFPSDIAYFGKTVTWDFLKQLPNCLPGTESFQATVKKYDSDYAKARYFFGVEKEFSLKNQQCHCFLFVLSFSFYY